MAELTRRELLVLALTAPVVEVAPAPISYREVWSYADTDSVVFTQALGRVARHPDESDWDLRTRIARSINLNAYYGKMGIPT